MTTLSRPDGGWARVAGRDVVREAAVRDSMHTVGPQLAFAAGTWKAFTEQLKAAA